MRYRPLAKLVSNAAALVFGPVLVLASMATLGGALMIAGTFGIGFDLASYADGNLPAGITLADALTVMRGQASLTTILAITVGTAAAFAGLKINRLVARRYGAVAQ